MRIKDYEVNPYAMIGGGLAGGALGLGAYLLDTAKSKSKLATYIAIGSALGVGTGALATLDKYKTEKQEKVEQKLKDAEDIPMTVVNMGIDKDRAIKGGVGGYLASRLSRMGVAATLDKFDAANIDREYDDAVKTYKDAKKKAKKQGRAFNMDAPDKQEIAGKHRIRKIKEHTLGGTANQSTWQKVWRSVLGAGSKTGRLNPALRVGSDLAIAATGAFGLNSLGNYLDR